MLATGWSLCGWHYWRDYWEWAEPYRHVRRSFSVSVKLYIDKTDLGSGRNKIKDNKKCVNEKTTYYSFSIPLKITDSFIVKQITLFIPYAYYKPSLIHSLKILVLVFVELLGLSPRSSVSRFCESLFNARAHFLSSHLSAQWHCKCWFYIQQNLETQKELWIWLHFCICICIYLLN